MKRSAYLPSTPKEPNPSFSVLFFIFVPTKSHPPPKKKNPAPKSAPESSTSHLPCNFTHIIPPALHGFAHGTEAFWPQPESLPAPSGLSPSPCQPLQASAQAHASPFRPQPESLPAPSGLSPSPCQPLPPSARVHASPFRPQPEPMQPLPASARVPASPFRPQP